HAVRMPAMIVVVAVVLGARLAGVPGALLGVPASAVIYTLSVHYGMRIRRAREAREAAVLGLVGQAAPRARAGDTETDMDEQQTEPRKATLSPRPVAGAAPERPAGRLRSERPTDKLDFQEQLREALEEGDEPPRPPRRARRLEEPS
ncbi:MAG: hypothetical protein WD645_00220, partial [Dehalococcoidia bacterium]